MKWRKRSLKELIRMRDALEILLVEGEWLGSVEVLERLEKKILYHIKHYVEYNGEAFE